MEEKPKPCRTPRKNPTPQKLVRINLEPPQLQSTSFSVSDSDSSCQSIDVGVRTCVSSTSEYNKTTKRQTTKRVSVDVKTKSFLDKDVSSISAMPKASKRCKESESRKRKDSDRLLEPLSKRRKCEAADVHHSNKSVESSRSKSNKPASKGQVDKKSQIHKDLIIQSQPKPKPRRDEHPESRKNCSALVAVSNKSLSQNTKQADDLIGQNTETSSILNLNSVRQRNSKTVSKDSSSERGNVCKRLFDVANECQAKDRTVANSVLPEVLKNTLSESNSDSAVMDLSLKSPNFSHSDLAFSFSTTSLTGTLFSTPKTELASEHLSESYAVLDLSTADTDKFNDSVSSQSSGRKNADDLSVSESAVRICVKCEDNRVTEELNSSVVENLPDESTEAKSSPCLYNSSAYTTSKEKEELEDLRMTAHLSPSDCAAGADLKQDIDKKLPTNTQPESESQVNVSDAHATPTATDGIQQLADELGVLNQQSSHVATHMYRRQTPRRKRSFGVRQLSTGMLSENSSSSGTPFRRFSRRTPSKSSPRVTPRRPVRTGMSPLVAKLIFASPAARNAICSPLKMRTPSKPTAKRKLYSDSPESQTEIRKLLASAAKSQNCVEKLPSTPPLDVELNSNETVRNVTDIEHSPTDVPSTPDQLRIVEDENDDDVPVFDFEIDNILEEKSKKFVHLTAKNVRSIIHQVLTNEDVKHIMRTALQEGSLKEQFQAAIFEPMLTRSKLKEVIEKGQILPPFSRNPLKTTCPKTFLDMNFPEEEDDEEYQPSKEELETYKFHFLLLDEPDFALHGSDEESVHSSQANDFGSPSVSSMPMRSRLLSSASESDTTPCGTPMGPPAAPPLRSQLTTEMIDKESNIALRTRSKLPLNDTSLVEIEASLVEPDSIPDLYDTECDEEDWAQFLVDLNRDFPCNDNLDDDLNDPEFDFLNEEENIEDDPEESRNDRAVQIPKKEVKQLVSEILEEHEEYDTLSELLDDLDEFPPASVEGSDALVSEAGSPCAQNTPIVADNSTVQVQQAVVTPIAEVTSDSNVIQFEARSEASELNSTYLSGYPGLVPPLRMNPPLVSAFMHELIKLRNTDNEDKDLQKATKTATSANEWNFTHNELNQLKDQMRKHVQVLAQSYVQSWPQFHDSELISLAASSKETLVQLKELAQCSVVPYTQSYFYTPNLEEAIIVTNQSYERKNKDISKILQDLMTEKVMCQKMYQIRGLMYEQMEVFLSSRAFIFPQMLPEYRMESLEEGEKKFRVMFSESEDNLLAMGMDQFGHLPNKYSLIRQYLLPTKTNDQLKYRFKNRKSKTHVMNPIKYLALHKRLPVFQQYLDVEDERSIVAPKDRDPDLLPKWSVAFKDAVQLYRKHQNLKPWTLCGVPGSYLLEHGDQFNNLARLSTREKECDILPQRQTQSVMQFVVANSSAPLLSLGSQPMTITDSSAIHGSQPLIIASPSIYLSNPSVTYSEQPVFIADSRANFANQSVTFAVPSMTMSASSVMSSSAYNNAGSGSVYQVVGTLYPMSSSEVSSNPATQMLNQGWPGMQVINLESPMTSFSTQLTNQATLTATQVAEPPQQMASLNPQMTSSSMLAANWAPTLVNQAALQMGDANTQAGYTMGASSVDPLILSTVNTQGFGWDAQATVPVTALPPSNGFVLNSASTGSQPSSHVVMEQSLSDSSFSLFSGLNEVLSDPLSCRSLAEPPATPSDVQVTTGTYSGSENVVNLSPGFLSSCFDNPSLLNSEIPVSNADLNREIPAVTSADAKIKDSWDENIVNSAATTAVVLSSAKGSNSQGFQSHSSVVLSPTKVISKLTDVPEPVLILTKEQLTQLGISVNVLSLPTVSTPKVMNQSLPTNRSVQEVQQEPVIEEDIALDPIQSPASSKLRSPEDEDDNSLLHVNTKDILNYAFAKAMGISMSDLRKSQEHDENLVSAETSMLETAEGQPRSETGFGQNAEDIQETQALQGTEQPAVHTLGRYFQRNETYDEINKYSMLTENSMETQENQTGPAMFSRQMSSGFSVEISQGEVAENPVFVRQSETVTSSETIKDMGENSLIDQSSFGFGGFGDMLRNTCSLSPRRGVLAEPDENATLCTPKKYVVLSPRAETSCGDMDLGIQSPDQSGFNSPKASAALHSSTPIRSPLCHQWRSPPVRSSTTSLRSKRKSLGHVSPIKFPLGNPAPFSSSSANSTSLFAVKPSTRKRERLGQRSLQPIAPRTFGVSTLPLKSAIGSLRVTRKRKKTEISSVMRRILPKPDATATDQHPNSEVYSTPPSGKRPKRLEKNAAGDEKSEVESSRSTGVGSEQMESEGDEAPTAGGCDMDSQNEEDNDEELHLAELLEASTTIRVPPRGSRSHPGHKAEQKKELALAMLAPDLVANDRLRDERDAMFARAYHCKVRKALENDVALYQKFLQQFIEFDQKCKTVEELYGEIKSLLSSYPELVSDFAGFLSPEQAVECQCLMTNYKFSRARTFMCKLEIYFQKHPPQLQKCMKAFKEWLDGVYSNDELYNAVLPHIRSNPHLVDEFSVFFEDKKPPQSHLSKYEEVTLGESDDETQDCDDYEKVDLSLQENSYGTSNCPCRCHVNGAELFVKKLRHCASCGLKVIKGELYLQTSDKLLRPATVTFHRQSTNKDEIPDQSTGHKLVTKFKTSKATSLKQRKSKKVSVCSIKDKSEMNGTMVMEPDSTSMMSPLNSDLGAENCAVAVETDDTDKSDDFTPEIDLVSSCHEMQMGSASQDGVTAPIAVSSSSNSCDVLQTTFDGSQFLRTEVAHDANCERDAEAVLSNDETNAAAVVKSSTECASAPNQLDRIPCSDENIGCGDGKDAPPVDDGSSRTGVRDTAENDSELSEQAIDKNCDILTGVKQDSGSLALDVSFEESSIEPHADQGSCSSEEEVRSVSQVESLPDVEANADHDDVNQDSVHHQFNVTTEVNSSLDSSDECQNENRAGGGSSTVNQSSAPWTSDEDGLILKTCQELDPEANAYQVIVETLTHRTVQEVSDRFDFLMNMIAEMNELSDGSATEDDDSDVEEGF